MYIKSLFKSNEEVPHRICSYGEEVERYLEVFLSTPGIGKEETSRALLARGKARRIAADKLLTRSHQGMALICQ